jgi:hypothetical protein
LSKCFTSPPKVRALRACACETDPARLPGLALLKTPASAASSLGEWVVPPDLRGTTLGAVKRVSVDAALASAATSDSTSAPLNELERELLGRLGALRTVISEESVVAGGERLAPYQVFGDPALLLFAMWRPVTLTYFRRVPDVRWCWAVWGAFGFGAHARAARRLCNANRWG